MTERWPRRALLGAAIAIAIILTAASIDYVATTAALPDFDPSFEFDPSQPTIKDPADAERRDLIDGYGDRVWLYALAIIAVVAALTVAALRAAPRDRRRELFTDLGVAGVVCGIGAAVLAGFAPALIVNSNQGVVPWLPAMALLIAAGLGTMMSPARDRGAPGASAEPGAAVPAVDGGPQGSRTASLAPIVSWAAIGLTVLTIALLVIAEGGRECGVTAPAWSDTMLVASLIAGVAAGVCGVAALLARRWLVALISIPAPLIALFGLVAAACLS